MGRISTALSACVCTVQTLCKHMPLHTQPAVGFMLSSRVFGQFLHTGPPTLAAVLDGSSFAMCVCCCLDVQLADFAGGGLMCALGITMALLERAQSVRFLICILTMGELNSSLYYMSKRDFGK